MGLSSPKKGDGCVLAIVFIIAGIVTGGIGFFVAAIVWWFVGFIMTRGQDDNF